MSGCFIYGRGKRRKRMNPVIFEMRDTVFEVKIINDFPIIA